MKLGEKIPGNFRIYYDEDVYNNQILSGITADISHCENIKNKLVYSIDNKAKEYMGDGRYITTKDIIEQRRGEMITIIHSEPLSGYVLQYGNYNEECFRCIGLLEGYA